MLKKKKFKVKSMKGAQRHQVLKVNLDLMIKLVSDKSTPMRKKTSVVSPIIDDQRSQD